MVESLPDVHYRLGFSCVRRGPFALEIEPIVSHPSEDHVGRCSVSGDIELELVGGNVRPVHNNVSDKVMSYSGSSNLMSTYLGAVGALTRVSAEISRKHASTSVAFAQSTYSINGSAAK